ncbi:hypothetical protein RUM44_004835 [Polyplax serrata]|uniref:Uncharacterized protein n=1 Tax=Polyplax serrata TaxID=468196 RepID=A0ABR1B5U1_POLSC
MSEKKTPATFKESQNSAKSVESSGFLREKEVHQVSTGHTSKCKNTCLEEFRGTRLKKNGNDRTIAKFDFKDFVDAESLMPLPTSDMRKSVCLEMKTMKLDSELHPVCGKESGNMAGSHAGHPSRTVVQCSRHKRDTPKSEDHRNMDMDSQDSSDTFASCNTHTFHSEGDLTSDIVNDTSAIVDYILDSNLYINPLDLPAENSSTNTLTRGLKKSASGDTGLRTLVGSEEDSSFNALVRSPERGSRRSLNYTSTPKHRKTRFQQLEPVRRNSFSGWVNHEHSRCGSLNQGTHYFGEHSRRCPTELCWTCTRFQITQSEHALWRTSSLSLQDADKDDSSDRMRPHVNQPCGTIPSLWGLKQRNTSGDSWKKDSQENVEGRREKSVATKGFASASRLLNQHLFGLQNGRNGKGKKNDYKSSADSIENWNAPNLDQNQRSKSILKKPDTTHQKFGDPETEKLISDSSFCGSVPISSDVGVGYESDEHVGNKISLKMSRSTSPPRSSLPMTIKYQDYLVNLQMKRAKD